MPGPAVRPGEVRAREAVQRVHRQCSASSRTAITSPLAPTPRG